MNLVIKLFKFTNFKGAINVQDIEGMQFILY